MTRGDFSTLLFIAILFLVLGALWGRLWDWYERYSYERAKPILVPTFLGIEIPPAFFSIGYLIAGAALLLTLLFPRSGTPSHGQAGVQAPSPTRIPTTRARPIATPSCLPWQEIPHTAVGQRLCVYGIVKRWYRTPDFATVIRFTENANDFILYDTTYTFTELAPGACVKATGLVENMGRRLAMNIGGGLFTCN